MSPCVRPGVPGAALPARAILSMWGLSYGVIRVNTEDKNSALTVQDVGHVMPGGERPREAECVALQSVTDLMCVIVFGMTVMSLMCLLKP